MPKKKNTYSVSSKVWLYPGNAAWHFLTVPKKDSDDIKKRFGKNARGWGSLPVEVTIGDTTWTTSIFPDSKSGTYLLPLKASVRRSEGLFEGEKTAYALTIRP